MTSMSCVGIMSTSVSPVHTLLYLLVDRVTGFLVGSTDNKIIALDPIDGVYVYMCICVYVYMCICVCVYMCMYVCHD
jgi:hypothetical protein